MAEKHNSIVQSYLGNPVAYKSKLLSQTIDWDSIKIFTVNQGFIEDLDTTNASSMLNSHNEYFSYTTRLEKIDYLKNQIRDVANSMGYSDEFIEVFDEILDHYTSPTEEPDIQQILAIVDNHSWQDNELNAASAFKSIVLGSSDLYDNYPGLKDSSWVILNDALGALLGLPFAGAGSIILCAAFSIGTNEGL